MFDFVLMLGVDVDSGAELPDYAGPYRGDLRFTDFSRTPSPPSSCRGASATSSSASTAGPPRSPAATATTPWPRSSGPPGTTRSRPSSTGCAPSSSRPAPPTTTPTGSSTRRTGRTRVTYTGLFTPRPDVADLTKEQLVRWLLGSHEYLLQCIEAWATQITVRYSLDDMFDIQWTLWGDTVLPGVKKLKAEYLGIDGDTVADWMKDLQVDATAMPGKAFDVSFEMPEPEVGIMTFNRCVAADQWETMGRPDILEKNCHSTCPKSMIETTKMYNPNMKVDILAIPPRKDPGDVCCKWRFSMRDESDPEYVPVDLTTKPRP